MTYVTAWREVANQTSQKQGLRHPAHHSITHQSLHTFLTFHFSEKQV